MDRLATCNYHQYGTQYPIFNDAAALSDPSITQFMDTIDEINRIKDPMLRADSAGTMQSLVGLWQIFFAFGKFCPRPKPTRRSRR